jgi:hypothetical protein
MFLLTRFTALSLGISVLAFVGSSPFWLKLLTRYFYSSGMHFFIKESRSDAEPIEPGAIVPYERIENLGITIMNSSNKHIEYSIIIHSGLWIDVEEQSETLFEPMEVEDNSSFSSVATPEGTSFSFVATGGILPPTHENIPGHSRVASSFPFTRPDSYDMPPSQYPFRIAIIPKVPLSEFGFPDFFGEAQLKPIIRDYIVENEYRTPP